MSEAQTTESLRATLFDAINRVKNGTMDPNTAKTISILAERIIKTAELELQYAQTCSRLDKEDQGVSPGPLLLTNKSNAGS